MAEQLHSLKYEGIEIKYDATALKKWSVQKKMAHAATDPAGAFDAYDAVLAGKSDEIAEKLGDDIDKMADVIQRIATIVGGDAKN